MEFTRNFVVCYKNTWWVGIPRKSEAANPAEEPSLFNLIGENMKRLDLNNGHETLVDEDMYEYLMQWRWGFDGRYAYRREHLSNGKYKKIYMQKIINQTPDGFDTDHINADKLDNRKENLRSATRSQNNANMPKIPRKCSSRFKGVCWHKQRKKWKAEIKLNGVRKHLGVFLTEEEAAEAYNKAALDRFGNFARLNQGE